jgi:hypothetical protein
MNLVNKTKWKVSQSGAHNKSKLLGYHLVNVILAQHGGISHYRQFG